MRLTIHTPTGAALKLNKPQTEQEARAMLMEAYKVAVSKLAAYEDAEEQGRLVVLPCPIGTPIFRIYNTRGCNNCTKLHSSCSGNDCPDPKFYSEKFSYNHLQTMEDIKFTLEAAKVALKTKEVTP